jgi:hypothetical protein
MRDALRKAAMDVAPTGGKRILRSDLQNRGQVLEAAVLMNTLGKNAVLDIS